MWVIIRWIRRNAYPLTALLLFIFSFNLVLRYQLYQHSFYFNQSVAFFRNIDVWRNNFTQYLNLKEENDYLKEENLILRKQLSLNYFNNSSHFDSSFYKDSSKSAPPMSAFRYFHANVIRSSTNKRDNYFYLNQGSDDSLEVGMAVLSPLGIAGIINGISDNYSRVMSVLNSKFEITSWIPDIGLRQGAVRWEFNSSLRGQIDEINRSEPVKKGQLILSSNYSSIFPPGTIIGKVHDVKKSKKSQYLNVEINFATDFKRLNHVYCVKTLFNKELDQLKNTEIND